MHSGPHLHSGFPIYFLHGAGCGPQAVVRGSEVTCGSGVADFPLSSFHFPSSFLSDHSDPCKIFLILFHCQSLTAAAARQLTILILS